MSFEEALQVGLIGEGLCAAWWQAFGWHILPAYEIEADSGKEPRLFMATQERLITPDMLCIKGDKACWAEAKTKSAFTWHRKTETFQTGIDRRHWRDYLKVSESQSFPMWLMFVHRAGQVAKNTPPGMESPSGLYAQDIVKLRATIDHEHANYGPSGMVYWRESAFKRLCDYEELVRIARGLREGRMPELEAVHA